MESRESTLLIIYNFLLDGVLSCPLQLPFPHPSSRKGVLLLPSSCPLSQQKNRQPATSYGSEKTRSERSFPQEKHLFLLFPYTSLGTQRVTPTPKKRAKAAPRARRAAPHKLMIGNQEQGMQVTKQNQILLSDLPLPSRRSHPCLLYPKPEHGIRNRLCNSFQPTRRAQTQRPCPDLPWSVSLTPCW